MLRAPSGLAVGSQYLPGGRPPDPPTGGRLPTRPPIARSRSPTGGRIPLAARPIPNGRPHPARPPIARSRSPTGGRIPLAARPIPNGRPHPARPAQREIPSFHWADDYPLGRLPPDPDANGGRSRLGHSLDTAPLTFHGYGGLEPDKTVRRGLRSHEESRRSLGLPTDPPAPRTPTLRNSPSQASPTPPCRDRGDASRGACADRRAAMRPHACWLDRRHHLRARCSHVAQWVKASRTAEGGWRPGQFRVVWPRSGCPRPSSACVRPRRPTLDRPPRRRKTHRDRDGRERANGTGPDEPRFHSLFGLAELHDRH
jgi:hypothetical protein